MKSGESYLKTKNTNATGAVVDSHYGGVKTIKTTVTIKLEQGDLVLTRKLTISSPDVPAERIHSEISARLVKIATENGASSISLGQLYSRLSGSFQ
jgi:hypothetical protein